MTQAYPLAWPAGWPRTRLSDRADGRGAFRRPSGFWTFAAARDELYAEFTRLGSPTWNTVVSSNFHINQRGEPSTSKGRPDDEGIAVYFRRGQRPFVMACDRFTRAEENMRSLSLAVAAMRQLERHGGGVMMERAFEGFAALPSPGSTPWWQVLQLRPEATRDEIEAAYRILARDRHPDRPGGSHAMMADLNRARDEALRERR